MTITARINMLGAALIVIIGLLTFHIPHFLLERSVASGTEVSWLELAFLGVVLGAIVAAVGIWRASRWGWRLGIVVVVVAILRCT